MKNVKRTIGTLLLLFVLAFFSPVTAQDAGGATTNTEDTRTNDDDTGKWGLAGLLGLLGLLGLRKRDDDRTRTTNVNR